MKTQSLTITESREAYEYTYRIGRRPVRLIRFQLSLVAAHLDASALAIRLATENGKRVQLLDVQRLPDAKAILRIVDATHDEIDDLLKTGDTGLEGFCWDSAASLNRLLRHARFDAADAVRALLYRIIDLFPELAEVNPVEEFSFPEPQELPGPQDLEVAA